MLKGKNVGLVSGMKGSLSFVFSVVSWDTMRGIVWNFQTNKIPNNMVIGFRLKGIQGWEWKGLNQPVVENKMVVARVGLKKIQTLQLNSLLV